MLKTKIAATLFYAVLAVVPTTVLAQTSVTNNWTSWLDRDNPDGTSDAEVLSGFAASSVCATPTAIEARIKGTTKVFTPTVPTPSVLRTFSATAGLHCYNVDQPNGACPDYEVRFLCAPPTLGQTQAVLENMQLFKLDVPRMEGNAIALATFKRDTALTALAGRFSFDDGEKIIAFNDLAEGADELANNGVFSAFVTVDLADIANARAAFSSKLSMTSQPVVREFAGRSVVKTQAFIPTNTTSTVTSIKGLRVAEVLSSLPAPIPPALVTAGNALTINDIGVVANPGLTFDMCNTDNTGNHVNPNAAWSFKTLISNLNDETTSGMTDQQFAHAWLRNWMVDTSVNGFTILNRRTITNEFDGWDGQDWRTLKMDRLPFRLLAIVNRIDLGVIPAYGSTAATKSGEIRFVFGILSLEDGQCRELIGDSSMPDDRRQTTVIFEYSDATTNCAAQKQLANNWIELDSIAGSAGPFNSRSTDYLTKLKAITNTVTGPNANKLNQLRTNDFVFTRPQGIDDEVTRIWQLREFGIDSNTKKLVPATIKLTPESARYNSPTTTPADKLLLQNYITAQSSAILCEQHNVPESFGGERFLGASTEYEFKRLWGTKPASVPTTTPACYASSIVPGTGVGLTTQDRITSEVRHKFAINTCDGCHSQETRTSFVHVSAADRRLSPFLTGIKLVDPATPGLFREFNDLARRNQILVGISAMSCSDPRIIRQFPALQSRFRFIH